MRQILDRITEFDLYNRLNSINQNNPGTTIAKLEPISIYTSKVTPCINLQFSKNQRIRLYQNGSYDLQYPGKQANEWIALTRSELEQLREGSQTVQEILAAFIDINPFLAIHSDINANGLFNDLNNCTELSATGSGILMIQGYSVRRERDNIRMMFPDPNKHIKLLLRPNGVSQLQCKNTDNRWIAVTPRSYSGYTQHIVNIIANANKGINAIRDHFMQQHTQSFSYAPSHTSTSSAPSFHFQPPAMYTHEYNVDSTRSRSDSESSVEDQAAFRIVDPKGSLEALFYFAYKDEQKGEWFSCLRNSFWRETAAQNDDVAFEIAPDLEKVLIHALGGNQQTLNRTGARTLRVLSERLKWIEKDTYGNWQANVNSGLTVSQLNELQTALDTANTQIQQLDDYGYA